MKKSYLKGFVGALIGGIIGSIPWVALSVFNNTMYAILTILIGLGAVKGYQMLNGKMSKFTPWLIGIVCLIVMTLSTFVFIPLIAFMKEDVPITIANLKLVFENAKNDLIRDYVIGIVFTFLGVSGIINQMSKEIKANGGNPDDIEINFLGGKTPEENNKIKDYFLDKKAISPTSAIELDGTEDLSDMAIDLLLKNKTLVLTSDNKYYYDTQREEKLKKSNKKAMIIGIVVMVAIFAIIIIFPDVASNNTNKNKNTTNTNTTYKTTNSVSKLKYDEPSEYKSYDEEKDIIYYYPKKDLSGEAGLITVSKYTDAEYYDGFTDDLKKVLKENEDDKILEIKELKNKNGLKVVKGSVEFTEKDGLAVDTMYYIFLDNGVTALVETVYYKDTAWTFEKDTKAIVESFKK